MKAYLFLFLVLALAACQRGETVAAPDSAQNRQLDEAETMLDRAPAVDAPAANAAADDAANQADATGR